MVPIDGRGSHDGVRGPVGRCAGRADAAGPGDQGAEGGEAGPGRGYSSGIVGGGGGLLWMIVTVWVW